MGEGGIEGGGGYKDGKMTGKGHTGCNGEKEEESWTENEGENRGGKRRRQQQNVEERQRRKRAVKWWQE